MINITRISDVFKNKTDTRAWKIYYFNLNYERIWQKIYYHYDLLSASKIIYYYGTPLTNSSKMFLEKQFYENGMLKSICSVVDGKIQSPEDDLPAIIEYSLDGDMCLQVFNENLETDIILTY